MKKNKKKLSKKKSIKKKTIRKKIIKKKPVRKKSIKKKHIKKLINQKGFKVKRKLKFIKKNIKNIKKKQRKISRTSKNAILKIIRFQDKLKPKFNFNFFESTKKFIKGFFQKITDTIEDYNIIKEGERKRKKLEEIQSIEKERIERDKQAKADEDLKIKLKEQAIKEDIKIEKEIVKDIKLFLRKEQAILRREQAEKQKQFLKQLQLERQIEKFRIREVKELEKLEKIALKEKREDYQGLQERIDKLKEKYRLLRDQKIKERVEALGVKLQGDEDRETLLEKEKPL